MQVGKRVILPSNHVGSPRYLYQNYQDAIAICRHYGSPHLFITFTCNPLWPEITRNLINGQTANDRPDLVCRVFKMKLDELIEDIRIDNHFGPVAALIYTVEFQKRGLPHAHIIVWLRDGKSLTNPNDIDSYISAELPNPDTKPIAYSVVTEFMIHGPCGHARPNSPCMKKGHCSKNFPKEFHDSTVMSDEGFVVYKRRDTGITVEKNGVILDNRYVVPHNLKLLMKYRAHINVERCHTTTMIKYLFKYVCKGRDRAYVTLQRTETNEQRQQTQGPQAEHATINEVSDYLDCRYIAPPEAIWRIFQYHIHYSNPTVERLPVHLPNENSVVFSDYQSLDELVSNEYSAKTKLTAWFELNIRDELARDLTYLQVTSYYTWHKDTKTWGDRMKGDRLSRMYFVHPRAGELYYLRILLNIVRGAKCFKDICTVDGQLYPTFKEACEAYGLLENDGEWINTMEEAAASANSEQLRHLFVEILLFSQAPMSNRICFEALDRTMRDILCDISPSNKHRLFGGVTVVLGGDFRQTLPVVPGASRYDTISASITNSYLWRSCIILKLTKNMRLTRYANDSTQRQKIEKFADWLLSIGNGTEETIKIGNNNEPEWVRIPENLLVGPGEDEKQAIIDATYPNLNAMYTNIPYLRQRAIITPKNDAVDLLNESVLALIPGNQKEYLSADSIDGSDNMSDDLRGVYPIEFLNTISGGNLPCHRLILKVGVPIMLLRNIDQPNGLCNGTRAIVTAMGTRIIQARVITGKYTDREICIPRIIFIHKSKTLPFVLRRRQFPVRLCYAMTINKSQGQSLDMIGLYLREPVFSHGQLYVALSRTTSADGLKILITNQDNSYAGYTKNIVFRQIFSLLGDV
ncbi:hypothetical protein LUZ63_017066 [Rhynchospora breviuscula]|uniref:ATP-dependent DNA helicase n=1 Tax=Rhynchospora breviuscula TaxID=2022672 RepID=A0A9Q0HEW7_9POAL|nr:hypothetical protein LUZ63_017066 [Rhynchospora breviuscula]